MTNTFQLPKDHKQLNEHIRLAMADGGDYEVTIKKVSKRTKLQNKSLWKWLTMLAEQMNDAGYDRIKTLEVLKKCENVEIPNTKDSLYNEYWLPVQRHVVPDKKGSSDLDTKEIQQVYETMNRHCSDTFKIGIPWPDRFNQEG